MDKNQEKVLPDCESIQVLTNDFNNYFNDKIKKIRENFSDNDVAFESSEFDGSLLWEFDLTTVEELRSIIKETGVKCSASDPLPKCILRDNLETVLPALCELVNMSLRTGNMDNVKLADVISTLKAEWLDNNSMKNYRPISNLVFIGKLIERVVLLRLNRHLKLNNLDVPVQSAYKKHHSSETLLIRISNDLLIASDKNSATILILLDLSAAFDTVDHSKLLAILEKEIGNYEAQY